jgi:formylglycine-generating enzyme required for sulfatase activity
MKRDKVYANHPAVNVSHEAATAFCEWLTDQYNRSATKKFKEVKFRLPTKEEWMISAHGVKNPVSYKLEDNTVEVKFYPELNSEGFGKKVEAKKVKVSDEDILYPWYWLYNFRNSPRNNMECFLGNFKLPEGTKTCRFLENKVVSPDGFIMMAPVKSYFPNELGLYDLAGNVEEMIDEKGKACGGSWDRLPEESTIKSVNTYTTPTSSLGFRVFMEVIQE